MKFSNLVKMIKGMAGKPCLEFQRVDLQNQIFSGFSRVNQFFISQWELFIIGIGSFDIYVPICRNQFLAYQLSVVVDNIHHAPD